MGTIKQRRRSDGTIVHEAYSKAGGRRKYLKVHATAELAAKAIRRWEAKVEEHEEAIAAGAAPVPLHSRSVKLAAKEWLKHLETPGVKGHRSRGKYEQQLRLHILPGLGDRPLGSLTTNDVETWMIALTSKAAIGSQCAEGALLSPQSAHTAKIALSSLLKYCVKKNWIPKNPARGIGAMEFEEREFQWIHHPEAMTALLAACGTDDLRDFVGIALATGMRMGEILSLHWSDVRLDQRIIRVARGSKAGPTKGGKPREIPVLDTALSIFKARKLRAGGARLVFPSPTTGGVRNYTAIRQMFRRAVDASGIEVEGMPPLRIHDLRHTFASQWVSGGGDIYRLSKVLGHRRIETTEKFYARFRRDAWEQDYARCAFVYPSSTDNVISLVPAGA